VIAWPGPGSERSLRRLQLAAEEGKSFGVIFGPTRNAANASPAALRIQLCAGRGRLEVQILKRRGGGWAPPLSLELDKKHLSLRSSFFVRPPAPSQSVGRNSEAYGAGCEVTHPAGYAALTRPTDSSSPSSAFVDAASSRHILHYRKTRRGLA
jgi:hypothetical protein